MKRRWLRWVRRLLLVVVCAGAPAVLAHTAWVRTLVRDRVAAALGQRTGLVFSAASLDYDLFRLTAYVNGLRISRPDSPNPPILSVRRLSLALTRQSLSGALEAVSIDADGVSLVVDLTKSTGPAAPFVVPAFTLARASSWPGDTAGTGVTSRSTA